MKNKKTGKHAGLSTLAPPAGLEPAILLIKSAKQFPFLFFRVLFCSFKSLVIQEFFKTPI
jgi:hypothetical protein